MEEFETGRAKISARICVTEMVHPARAEIFALPRTATLPLLYRGIQFVAGLPGDRERKSEQGRIAESRIHKVEQAVEIESGRTTDGQHSA